MAVGQQAALNAILNRANDGAFPANAEVWMGTNEIGQWRSTTPLLLPLTAPWMGNLLPFVQKDTEGQLHEPPPPHLTSGKYTRDYNEVKAMGRRTGSSRTPEQTRFARFYSGNFVIILQGVLRTVSLARLTDIGDSARLFALANMSGADSLINVWNNKRLYNVWRPSTAINEGDNDGNPRTAGDPAWLPLIDNPPYPDYTSGANGVIGATMRALEHFFGDDVWTFIATTSALENNQPIAPRTYHSFSAMADDVSRRASCSASTSGSPTRWRGGRANSPPTRCSRTRSSRWTDRLPGRIPRNSPDSPRIPAGRLSTILRRGRDRTGQYRGRGSP